MPLSTTLPIFIGSAIRGLVDIVKKKRGDIAKEGEEDLEKGNLFATGLVAGGALLGVLFAFLNISNDVATWLTHLSVEHGLTETLGEVGYYLLSTACFGFMGWVLFFVGKKKSKIELE